MKNYCQEGDDIVNCPICHSEMHPDRMKAWYHCVCCLYKFPKSLLIELRAERQVFANLELLPGE